ncbi:hypothetical protein Esti_004646 [Eimeria stiedai]
MARAPESKMQEGEAHADHLGSDLPDEWHTPDKAAAVGANMLLMELKHAKSCVYLGPEHASIFSTHSSGVQTPRDGDAGAHSALTDNTRIDIALLPAATSSLAASGALAAAPNSMFFASERAVGANATCVTYAVKPGVVRVVCVLEQDAQQNATLYRVTLPDPPPGFTGPRVATGLSLCQEKPHFLLTRDQHGLVNVYKRRLDASPANWPPAEGPASANAEADAEAPAAAAAAACGAADGTAPFLQLQLQPEHGSLLDAFWLPPMAQESEGGEVRASPEKLNTEGGCFFVTAQEHRVTVWSLPLLRSLAVTLRRQPHPVLAYEAEAADCCCCVLPLREAAAAARTGPPDYFSLHSSNATEVRVHSVCCAAKQGCLVVGLGGRLVSAWRLRLQRNAVQGAVLLGTQQLPPLFGGASGTPGLAQKQQPEALNSNPFFTPCSAPFAAGGSALQQQDQSTQVEDADSDLPFQVLLLYGSNPAAAAAGAPAAAAAETPYLAACSNKGALFVQLLSLQLAYKPQQERWPLLGPCQQTLCFGSPEDLTFSINCSENTSSSTSSTSSSDFHTWAITDPSQRFAVVGVTRMCSESPRSHLCIFDAQQQRQQQQQQQEVMLPLSSVLLMRLDLPMVRLGAAVVAGAPAAGTQHQGPPDEGAAVYCYCVFVADKERQQQLPQQQLQQRQPPDLLRLHYIECSKLTAAATLDWQRVPRRAPIAAAGPVATTACSEEEAAKHVAALAPAAPAPAETGGELSTAAEVAKDAAAAESEEVDPAGTQAPHAPPADAASPAAESSSSGAAQRAGAAALPEQDAQQAVASAPPAETAAAAATPAAAESAAAAAPAAAEPIASDPAILLALRVPPAAGGLPKNEAPAAATAELASNDLLQLLLGRNKGPCSAILEAPAEAVAAARSVSPPANLSAALPGAAEDRGISSLPAASAASQECSKAPVAADNQKEFAAAASPTETATPAPAAPSASAAKDKADGTPAAATTGGRRKGKQQQQQQAAVAAAATASSAAAAAAEPATASPAAASGKATAASPGGAAAGSGATLKGSGGSSKPADLALQQQSPKHSVPLFGAAAAASETVAEAAIHTAGGRPVTMGAIETLLAKATGELTQKISAAANGAAKANANNQQSEKQQQQRLAALVAAEVQRLFSAQLQTAVQEACEAAKVAALGHAGGRPAAAVAAAQQQQNLLQSVEASVSEQLQQHLASACKMHEEQQRLLQQQMHHLVHGLQQQLQKWQQNQQQQIQQLSQQIQQMQQQTVLQQQQVQHLQHLHEKVQERQLALEEAPTGRLLDNLEALLRAQDELMHKASPLMQEARDEAKQAVAQQQHQQQVQQQQHAVMLEQLTQLSAQVGGLSVSSRVAGEGALLALSAGEPAKVGVSSRPKARTDVLFPMENERDFAAHFTRKLNTALEEKRYDDAFGLAVSADLQKGSKGQWLRFLCGSINPTHFFDMDPPPLGQAALLGVVKVLSDALAAEAMSAELGSMETKALWVCEALMQLSAPSKNIAAPDLLELLQEYKMHLVYAQSRIRTRFQVGGALLDERMTLSLKQLKRLCTPCPSRLPYISDPLESPMA